MFYLRYNSDNIITIYLVDNVDGYTPETEITSPTIQISKNGNNFEDIVYEDPSAIEWRNLGNGLYSFELEESNCDTIGDLTILIIADGCCNYIEKGKVIPINVYDQYLTTGKIKIFKDLLS
jgi:hypothetical protein